ncbi:RNA-binding domain-containing protein [Wenzhouxiangella sediminis]|uniref:Transcriptional regulator n=1 Tax=Wenzhouxiangella sediminis TaxID=1792836 RepID=A0A3E1KC22_9GAMM|nr:RNA-binding domain-containing protein [Wenzhouxiangella sediminis]RFF31605.1 transcriptional regulator [Wenzhouxiangella sediminis]
MRVRKPEGDEEARLLSIDEGHFVDLKSKRINPAKLQQSFVAFANSDGGELFVGVEDKSELGERIVGFTTQEECNGILPTLLEDTQPAVENVDVELIDFGAKGLILRLFIPKSPKVHYTANGDCYIRIGAEKRKIKGERVTQLSYGKGALVYERKPVDGVDVEELESSEYLSDYMTRVGSNLSPVDFLRKQKLLTNVDGDRVPNVGGVLLFDESPSASLPTRCSFKVYRLLTTSSEYKREQLAEMPTTIEGPLEAAVREAMTKVETLLEGATFKQGDKLVKLKYPVDAIKEIVVNAALHRDYSLNDDIHIKIYDNRIEVVSPGRLPGFMTVENLYTDRFSRNPNINRMIHNVPDPLNHDIGEGLDTARNELKKAGLVAPEFEELENSFLVTIRHQELASLEDTIMGYLNANPAAEITNRKVRELSGEEDINKVKKALQKLRQDGVIEPVDPNASAFAFRYRLVGS